jgi:IS30 family transposase
MKVLLQVLFYVAGHLCSIVARLNSIPRKVLNYQTPLEVFTSYMMVTGRIES